MAESRFRREDYAEYMDWQNAVYAAWKTNPDDPDPAVRWIAGLIGKVDAIERGEVKLVDITDLSNDELMARWARPKGDEPQTVSLTDTLNRRRYTLRELLDQCDPTAPPVPEIDFGPPVGAEFGSPDFEEKLLEPKGIRSHRPPTRER